MFSKDAEQSARALAKLLGMSQPAICRWVRRLEKNGAIKGYRLFLDREKLGFGVIVFLGIKLSEKKASSLKVFLCCFSYS